MNVKSPENIKKEIQFRKKPQIEKQVRLKLLAEKIANNISRKHLSVFEAKGYSQQQLAQDVEFLTKSAELDNLLFDRLVLEVEKVVLLKVIRGREIEQSDAPKCLNNAKPFSKSLHKSLEIKKNGKNEIVDDTIAKPIQSTVVHKKTSLNIENVLSI